MVTVDELREMDCSVLKRLMNRDENGGGAGGSGSHGALGLLSGGKCLLLDCRPFLAHSAGYIRGSVNVRCNTIVRRRAKGSVSLEQILPAEEEVRARLRSGLYSAVIVYDERSPRAESLREDSTDRRGEIKFRIKPHTCQRCLESSNKPCVQTPQTEPDCV